MTARLVVAAALVWIAGCGDDPTTGDDTSTDSPVDTGVDTVADTSSDTETDTNVDTETDTETDVPVGVDMGPDTTIVFLHHSTGGRIWDGGVPGWFDTYNSDHSTAYDITEIAFPSSGGYGWENYPYDYWNIWVQNAGPDPYMTEPTLEMLTAEYDVIVFKHCYPVSGIVEDSGSPDVSSPVKSIENYQLQYAALKDKLHGFPDNRFIVWTGAALVQDSTDEGRATRARQFFTWVKDEWDEPGDNIFVWDFFELETGGGIYMLDEHADSSTDSHPNATFSAYAAPLFGTRVVHVIQGTGDITGLTGE